MPSFEHEIRIMTAKMTLTNNIKTIHGKFHTFFFIFF